MQNTVHAWPWPTGACEVLLQPEPQLASQNGAPALVGQIKVEKSFPFLAAFLSSIFNKFRHLHHLPATALNMVDVSTN